VQAEADLKEKNRQLLLTKLTGGRKERDKNAISPVHTSHFLSFLALLTR